MTRKRLRALVCLLALMLAFWCYLPTESRAADDQQWEWTLENGRLTISGQGEMLYGWRPWEKHRQEITSVVFEEGITTIAIFTLMSDYDNLTHVILPKSLTTIEGYAFRGCPNLQKVTYRGSLRKLSQLDIEDGNDYLLQARWVQSSGHQLLQAFLWTFLIIGLDLLLAFFIYRRVQKRRMRPPRDFSEVVSHENL